MSINKDNVDYIVRYKYKNTNYIIVVQFIDNYKSNNRGIYVNEERMEKNSFDFIDNKNDNIIKVII